MASKPMEQLAEILSWEAGGLSAALSAARSGENLAIGDIRELLDWAAENPREAHELSDALGAGSNETSDADGLP